MPLWLLLSLLGGGYYWYRKQHPATAPVLSSATQAVYTVVRDTNGYQSYDPSAGPSVPISVPMSTLVHATTTPPTMSADSAYALVTDAAGHWIAPMYMSIADLKVT